MSSEQGILAHLLILLFYDTYSDQTRLCYHHALENKTNQLLFDKILTILSYQSISFLSFPI